MKRERIAVNMQGIDADGNDFEFAAEPWAVQAGLMVNVPVTLIYPGGEEVSTLQAKITPKGMVKLAEILPREGGTA